jgi:hypothetical protein
MVDIVYAKDHGLQEYLRENKNGNVDTYSRGVVAGGTTPRLTATYTRAANATQYDIGDLIGNSTTAASVVPIEFDLSTWSPYGRLSSIRCVVTAASGTIVLPAFDLLLFRVSAASIPFTAGSYPADNAACNITSAAYQQCVAVFSFSASSWRNQAGGATAAGAHIYQRSRLASAAYAPFNIEGLSSQKLLGLMQAQNTWNPGNVAQQFDFALDADLD